MWVTSTVPGSPREDTAWAEGTRRGAPAQHGTASPALEPREPGGSATPATAMPRGASLPLLFLTLSRAAVKASTVSRSSAPSTRQRMKRGVCRADGAPAAGGSSSAETENGHSS